MEARNDRDEEPIQEQQILIRDQKNKGDEEFEVTEVKDSEILGAQQAVIQEIAKKNQQEF